MAHRRLPDLDDLLCYPADMRLGDMLQRLAFISPRDVDAITLIVDDTLRRRWRALYYPTTTFFH